MTRLASIILPALLLASPAAAGPVPSAEPDAPTPARFAVIVGVNDGVDKDAATLRYADDDAAGFLELFRGLGARTYLLSRFDDNTRRLHPQAFAEAQEPRLENLGHVLHQVAADVATARRRHVPTVLYFVYAGHGNVENGSGYLALEDSRLFGRDLEKMVVDKVGAGETHFIVDACYSVFLAAGRGPGGEREEAHGFSSTSGLGARPDVGLLLSTSSARESHEWSQFQAGIFSHEVRSGLLGAADVDRNGLVTYREIAAFIERANAPIPNDKYRPDVFVKEPTSSVGARVPALLDLRPGLAHRLELDGGDPGHYLLEDTRGVRQADFHNASGQALRIIRLPSAGPLFLRRVDDAREYLVDTTPDVLQLKDLPAQASTEQARGAAHESFTLLFTLPFSQQLVDQFVLREADAPSAPPPGAGTLRRRAAVVLLGAGVLAAAGATWALSAALSDRGQPLTSQQQVYDRNNEIGRRNLLAGTLYGVGAAALATGTLLLLWPKPRARATMTAGFGSDGASLGLQGIF